MRIVKHDRNCKNLPQTEIKKIDPKIHLTDEFILKIQKSGVITYSASSPSEINPPADLDTCPPLNERNQKEFAFAKGRARHYTRSEALRRIQKDELILHRDEIGKRDAALEKLLADLFNIREYWITPESYLTDFMNVMSPRKASVYPALARKIKKIYGFSICAGCLREAKYIWRQADLIERYRKASGK